MTRDQIEKRAVAIKDSQNYHMSFEDAQDYISKCGFDIPWNDGDVFVDDREITRTIGNVLKWRINSVWHDAEMETPRNNEPIIGITGKICCYMGLCGETAKEICPEMKKWAYISDLIPDRKEEAG